MNESLTPNFWNKGFAYKFKDTIRSKNNILPSFTHPCVVPKIISVWQKEIQNTKISILGELSL